MNHPIELTPPYTTKTKHPKSVSMTKTKARALIREISPYLKGMVVGEHPVCEELAKLLGVDLKLVS